VSALAGVRAGFEKNKKPLAILGAVAVAGLAVVARRKSAMGSATSTGSTSTSSTTPAAATRYGASTQQGAYDSTGSDVYNALQPQIEQLQQLARQIPVAGATPATATPTAPAAPADPRRAQIISDYQMILNRTPGTYEVNAWDATGSTLDQIRQGIVASPEAGGVK
jgi:hypothetical protein